jgi:hypothetical protein
LPKVKKALKSAQSGHPVNNAQEYFAAAAKKNWIKCRIKKI